MKTVNIIAIVIAMLLTACNGLYEKPSGFQSKKLVGRYSMDVTPLVDRAIKTREGDNKWKKLGKSLTKIALSSVDATVTFYEHERGLLRINGGVIDLTSAISGKHIEPVQEFDYKVEEDSTVYIKRAGSSEYKKWATVEQYSKDYDYIRLSGNNQNDEEAYFNLTKVDE